MYIKYIIFMQVNISLELDVYVYINLYLNQHWAKYNTNDTYEIHKQVKSLYNVN